MSNYTQTNDFSSKDSLTTGDPEKVILGADVDVELAAIAAAIASKFDTSNDGPGSGLDADSVDGVGPVAAGTYTPTFTEVANGSHFSVSAAGAFNYIRLGNMVLVTGRITANVTTANSVCQFRFDLPVASNLANSYELSGTAVLTYGALSEGSVEPFARVEGNAANNAALLIFTSTTVQSDIPIDVCFMYKVI